MIRYNKKTCTLLNVAPDEIFISKVFGAKFSKKNKQFYINNNNPFYDFLKEKYSYSELYDHSNYVDEKIIYEKPEIWYLVAKCKLTFLFLAKNYKYDYETDRYYTEITPKEYNTIKLYGENDNDCAEMCIKRGKNELDLCECHKDISDEITDLYVPNFHTHAARVMGCKFCPDNYEFYVSNKNPQFANILREYGNKRTGNYWENKYGHLDYVDEKIIYEKPGIWYLQCESPHACHTILTYGGEYEVETDRYYINLSEFKAIYMIERYGKYDNDLNEPYYKKQYVTCLTDVERRYLYVLNSDAIEAKYKGARYCPTTHKFYTIMSYVQAEKLCNLYGQKNINHNDEDYYITDFTVKKYRLTVGDDLELELLDYIRRENEAIIQAMIVEGNIESEGDSESDSEGESDCDTVVLPFN